MYVHTCVSCVCDTYVHMSVMCRMSDAGLRLHESGMPDLSKYRLQNPDFLEILATDLPHNYSKYYIDGQNDNRGLVEHRHVLVCNICLVGMI
jgi:hypothetical protein